MHKSSMLKITNSRHVNVPCINRNIRNKSISIRCDATLSQHSISPLLRLTATATSLINKNITKFKHSITESIKQANADEINAQIKENVRHMRMLAIVAPFAAVTGGANTFFIITKAVASFINLYLLLLFVRVLLSWFPTFTWWEQQPWLALRQVTDPYLKLFSGLVPPLLGTIDLTPLFGFFILQFLAGALDVEDDETMYWS